MTTQKLPPFKKAPANKAKKVDNRKTSLRVLEAKLTEAKAKVLGVIDEHHGKATWNTLRKQAIPNGRLLGLALKDLMAGGRVKGPTKPYPGWESTALYRLVVVKALKAA
jgi:hypothetical protein